MMLTPLQNTLTFIFSTISNIAIGLLLLRMLLHIARADFYNPLCQAIYKVTQPIVKPLQIILPRVVRTDVSPLVLASLLQTVEIIGLQLLKGMQIIYTFNFWGGMFFIGLAHVVDLLVQIYIFAIFIRIILSWINSSNYNPAIVFLIQLTEPVLRPARKIIPQISGLDLSPILALFLLGICQRLVVGYLSTFGYMLMS